MPPAHVDGPTVALQSPGSGTSHGQSAPQYPSHWQHQDRFHRPRSRHWLRRASESQTRARRHARSLPRAPSPRRVRSCEALSPLRHLLATNLQSAISVPSPKSQSQRSPQSHSQLQLQSQTPVSTRQPPAPLPLAAPVISTPVAIPVTSSHSQEPLPSHPCRGSRHNAWSNLNLLASREPCRLAVKFVWPGHGLGHAPACSGSV